MKYAIISDIHGNNVALQHVLKDAKENGAERYIFVGDYCVSAPWPKEVVETLQGMDTAYLVKGNEEQYLYTPESDDGQFEISRWCKHQLSAEQIEWLNHLPEQLSISDGKLNIYVAHASEKFIGPIEFDNFGPYRLSMKYPKETVLHQDLLGRISDILDSNKEFEDILNVIPKGIYIFGHSHIQWHKQTDNHLFINPGSCGMPLDCAEFGAPYTLVTIENGMATVEERRVKYDVYELINSVKATDQYKEAYVWSEIIFREWIHSRERLCHFLQYAEMYANEIGDKRRPFAKDTWTAAFSAMNEKHS